MYTIQRFPSAVERKTDFTGKYMLLKFLKQSTALHLRLVFGFCSGFGSKMFQSVSFLETVNFSVRVYW